MNPDPDDVTFQFNQIQLTNEDADVSKDDSKSVKLTPENDDVANDDGIDPVSQLFKPENDDVEKSPGNEDSQQFTPEELPENSPEKDDVDSGDNDVTFASSQVRINNNKEMKPVDADVDGEDDDVDDEDDDVTFGFSQANADVEGEEFTFMCINSDNEITELTEKTVFPLFDQNSNEMNIKSNSTGFSKLWRFRDNNNINRSNSDGRDAFVFLNNEGGNGKGKGKEVVKKKVKKANVGSAHEVYLKQKGGGEEEFKRKSYLPYRPGLMGFFTNVNGGLSKNVHPF
ncbi:hypothetical protein CTI12_AA303070 [Artemisia annua]|uniref:Uncharacterized protein n=1 Tax=Artemisia annua TaxID=35608 RepID=A0A2U1N627_ARTAN|nr:hypothetical protein CTI12_AA303070 [Artemisia annua]